jgi:hypothetical protein
MEYGCQNVGKYMLKYVFGTFCTVCEIKCCSLLAELLSLYSLLFLKIFVGSRRKYCGSHNALKDGVTR